MNPLGQIGPQVGPLTPESAPRSAGNAVNSKSFSSMISESIKEVEAQQQQADKAIEQLHGGGGRNLHEVMIALEKADISMRFLVQVRNKALEAYQEISRLQV